MRRSCTHTSLKGINPYETVRKYECQDCGEVMMCECDEDFGRKHRPHQLSQATRLETKERIPVTLGFQPRICDQCRGLPEVAHAVASIPGRTSKIRRYYWREISIRSAERFENWATANGLEHAPLLHHEPAYRVVYNRLEREVLSEIKAEHEICPKYKYEEKTADDVLRENNVVPHRLDATYVKPATRGCSIFADGEIISVEEFAARSLRGEGFEVLPTESTPFHVLFGCLMHPLVCDPKDPSAKTVCIQSKDEANDPTGMISFLLPTDFGSSGYGIRRAKEIEERLSKIAAADDGVAPYFDDCFAESWSLRQYLWAHRLADAETARALCDVIPTDRLIKILRHLATDYWRNYVGWPDLVAFQERAYLFAEVKGSGDKLSEEQKRWIEGNTRSLKLPYRLIKVHRTRVHHL